MTRFRRLTLAALAAALVPRLAHRGMFVDGVTYAAIARNLAEGRGTFWAPHYTATLYPAFHEHPPLGLWLESLWFRVLGDHVFVERLYALTVALTTAALIVVFWRRLDGPAKGGPPVHGEGGRHAPTDVGSGFSRTAWLPVLLWIAIPVVSWAAVGNLLEPTVSLFTLAAVLGVLQADRATTTGRALTSGALSGLCVAAAFLTKGPVGLLPLIAPVVCPALFRHRRLWITLATQWTVVAASALTLAAIPDARAALVQYLDQQVFAALAGRREVGPSFAVIKELLQGVAWPIAVAAGLFIASAGTFVRPSQATRDRAVSLLLLGLAGSLPIAASVKQAGHYIVPAIPFFALAAAVALAPTVTATINHLTPRRAVIVTTLSALIAVGAAVGAFVPAVGRDRARLADLDALAADVPYGATIGICPEANDDWGLHAWFQRRFHASLDAASWRERAWLLKTGAGQGECPPARCRATTDPSRTLVLLTCPRER